MSNTILSRRFLDTLRLHNDPQYRIAWRAGINPTVLSKLTSGYSRPKPNDPRVTAVGAELGLKPEECFETVVDARRLVKAADASGAA